jgi:DNA polymerase-3 subunit delta'
MAAPDRDEASIVPPAIGPALSRAALPWLGPPCARLAAMQDQGRLPHGLLLFGQPGAGQTELGLWVAARLLCRSGATKPCGGCTDCRLFLAGSHPDFRWISVASDKKEISIEQMRTLSDALSLRSYRGGAKVALIEPAEAMNIKSFNALLKTLEEPSDDTFLLLATSRSDRMPRTIASRCMRLRVPLPETAAALAWLSESLPRAGWDGLLRLAHGAPFLAIEYADAGLENLDQQMRDSLAAGEEGRMDIIGAARAWAENAPAARLFWLESWLTRSLKDASLSSDLVNDNRLPWLRRPGLETKIRAGYRLLDQLRDARRLAGGSLNTQLLFEGLLVPLAALLGSAADKVQESLE